MTLLGVYVGTDCVVSCISAWTHSCLCTYAKHTVHAGVCVCVCVLNRPYLAWPWRSGCMKVIQRLSWKSPTRDFWFPARDTPHSRALIHSHVPPRLSLLDTNQGPQPSQTHLTFNSIHKWYRPSSKFICTCNKTALLTSAPNHTEFPDGSRKYKKKKKLYFHLQQYCTLLWLTF